MDKEEIKKKVIEALKNVYDPEIPVDVWNLGLIYGIDVDDEGKVKIRMTLTAPGCPVANIVALQAEETVREMVPEAKDVEVEIVFDPPWDPRRVTPEGRRLLKELFGYDVVEEWIKRAEELQQEYGS